MGLLKLTLNKFISWTFASPKAFSVMISIALSGASKERRPQKLAITRSGIDRLEAG